MTPRETEMRAKRKKFKQKQEDWRERERQTDRDRERDRHSRRTVNSEEWERESVWQSFSQLLQHLSTFQQRRSKKCAKNFQLQKRQPRGPYNLNFEFTSDYKFPLWTYVEDLKTWNILYNCKARAKKHSLGDNVINTFHHSGVVLCWNNRLWFVKYIHDTSFDHHFSLT